MRRHGGPNTKTHRRLQSRERRWLRQRVRSPGAEPEVSMIGAPEEARRCRGPRCLSGEGGRRAQRRLGTRFAQQRDMPAMRVCLSRFA
jgi:hypothetical protein